MAKAEKTPAEYYEEPVTIRIPHERGKDDQVYVAINERNWLIKRGVEVTVPRCVAELLRQTEDFEEEAYRRKVGLQH